MVFANALVGRAGFRTWTQKLHRMPLQPVDMLLYSGKHQPHLYLDQRVRANISAFANLADQDELGEGLEHLRRAGVAPDDRVTEAIELVASKRGSDGRWPLDIQYPGRMPVEIDEGEGRPSRWNTLRALRVLRWYDAGR